MTNRFPRSMRYDDRFEWWRGTVKLPEFRNIRVTVPGVESTSSTIELRVEADEDGPVEEQRAAYRFLRDNQVKVVDACLKGVAKTAKKMRPILEEAGWFEPKRLNELLPRRPTAASLRTRVRLYDVCITDREMVGIAHIAYSFRGAWDQEHGQLIVLHRDHLVYAGLTGDGWRRRPRVALPRKEIRPLSGP